MSKIELTLSMDIDDMSCMSCKRNYACDEAMHGRDDPSYCQQFNIPVNPRAVAMNKRTAGGCAYYWPHFIPMPAELIRTTGEQFSVTRFGKWPKKLTASEDTKSDG